MVRECYSETTKVAWAEFDTVQLLRDQDPVAWRCALGDYESQEESEATILSFDGGSTYYWLNDVEQLLIKGDKAYLGLDLLSGPYTIIDSIWRRRAS